MRRSSSKSARLRAALRRGCAGGAAGRVRTWVVPGRRACGFSCRRLPFAKAAVSASTAEREGPRPPLAPHSRNMAHARPRPGDILDSLVPGAAGPLPGCPVSCVAAAIVHCIGGIGRWKGSQRRSRAVRLVGAQAWDTATSLQRSMSGARSPGAPCARSHRSRRRRVVSPGVQEAVACVQLIAAILAVCHMRVSLQPAPGRTCAARPWLIGRHRRWNRVICAASQTMTAVQYAQYGPPGVLEVAQVPPPARLAGEVLVRVTATSVNPVDIKCRRGDVPRFQAVRPKVGHSHVRGQAAALPAPPLTHAPGACCDSARAHPPAALRPPTH